MPSVGYPSLEQLTTFAAVADAGSFSGAARTMHRAQSVVSYAIGQLEQQLGVTLFDRTGRTPVLTDAGRGLLGEARRAGAAVDSLRARAAGLQAGLEAELHLGLDVMLPNAITVRSLDAFAAEYPTVSLRLCVEALGGVAALVDSGECDLGVSTELATMPRTLQHRPAGSIRLIPVAAPGHPLARATAPLAPELVRDATQIVLTDRSRMTEGREIAVLSLKTWRIGDLGAKHALLMGGLGWGNMPEALVEADLAAGRLVRLDLVEGRAHTYPLGLIQRRDRLLGPAAQWMEARLRDAIGLAR